MRHALIEHKILHPRREYFAFPESGVLRPFADVLEEVNALPVNDYSNGNMSLSAQFSYEGKARTLTVQAFELPWSISSVGRIVHLPSYGFSSGTTKKLLDDGSLKGIGHKGVDLFHRGGGNFNTPYFSAEGAQYAYALGMRMVQLQVQAARKFGYKVGVTGISYGANVLSAYLAQGIDLPDAVFAVEGGSMSDLAEVYSKKTDPRTLAAFRDPSYFPPQDIPDQNLGGVCAVINPNDTTVLGQAQIWKNAVQLELSGSHTLAPVKHREEIRRLAAAHFGQYLR